jgi:hypothetical protein
MGLETGTYIDDLVATNPVSGDQLSQADDHLRLIKSFILASFPNITGAMTATHTILNGLDGRVTTLEAQNVVLDNGDTLTGTWTMPAATWTDLGTVTTVDINGGSIDGAIIGAASAAAGTFAALVGTTFNATGAATFGSTVALNADPTTALQAATKQYVDAGDTAASAVVPFIDGLTLSNNATDVLKDIDISAGSASDATRAKIMTLASGLTKKLDAAWAVGTNAGALDGSESVPGTPDASTWYHIWLIMRSDTGVVDILASESATAPTMPTNYDYKLRIGAVLFDATPDLVKFRQKGDHFSWDLGVTDVNNVNGSSAGATVSLTVPLGVVVQAETIFSLNGLGSGANDNSLLTPLVMTNVNPSSTNFHTKIEGNDECNQVRMLVETDTSQQVRHRSTTGGSARKITIITMGWIDPRGRVD